ncbi:twin-arginine translocation pathway signal protein [Burkholderiaceae bacterium 16]|nr:twin-arginine translocation pathway signal protein [Burkholderiaceae bacterium 16]
MTKPPSKPRRLFLSHTGKLALAGAVLPLAPLPALATLPDARSLAFDHTHTGERIAVVYAVGEQFVPESLAALNRFLRDHYSGEVGVIDPQLFALLYRLKQTLCCEAPFQVISGYRSPATNARLRKTRGGGVASHSLHMDGKAIDIRLPGVPLADLRDAALSLRGGGVGFYPQEQFVHADTGRVRDW